MQGPEYRQFLAIHHMSQLLLKPRVDSFCNSMPIADGEETLAIQIL
jgi:hypothetical protein